MRELKNTMTGPQGQLIVALDVDTWGEAKALVDALSGVVDTFKIGSQLFTACGPQAVRYVLKKQKKVFLDLKFHDIPNTVAGAVKSAVGIVEEGSSIFMCTLHTVGGKEMLRGAVEAAAQAAQKIGVTKPLLVGITVLTSEEKKDSIHHLVLERASLARNAGLDGVVASSQEAALIRKEFGENFIIVTPGIRSRGSDTQDQKRVTTPSDAIRNGSNFLVVGRPIVKAQDPVSSARSILEEIKRA